MLGCLGFFSSWYGVWMVITLTSQKCVDSSNAVSSQWFKYMVCHIYIHKVHSTLDFYRPWDSAFWSGFLRIITVDSIGNILRKPRLLLFSSTDRSSLSRQRDETGRWDISQSPWVWRGERKVPVLFCSSYCTRPHISRIWSRCFSSRHW